MSQTRTGSATGSNHAEEISLFEVGSVLLRRRWSIARWMIAGGLIAIIPVIGQKQTYTSTTTFVPQGAPEPAQSGIRTLAGQFGLSLGGGNQAQSPEFYSDLLRSRVILTPVVLDTVTLAGGSRDTILDILEIQSPSAQVRIDAGVKALRGMINPGISRETGVLTVNVTTTNPHLSFAIAQRLTANVNAFNLRKRQSAATEERRFTENRMAEAKVSLRAAEERLQSFLQGNRQFLNSSDLMFQRDRLQREVDLQQEIVMSLARTLEEVRVREIRDLPVITVIEDPVIPAQANPRGRLRRLLFGLFAGMVVGGVLAFFGEFVRRRRASGDPEAMEFFGALSDVRGELTRALPARLRRTN